MRLLLNSQQIILVGLVWFRFVSSLFFGHLYIEGLELRYTYLLFLFDPVGAKRVRCRQGTCRIGAAVRGQLEIAEA